MACPAFKRIGEIFQDPQTPYSQPRRDPPLHLLCRFESILMYLMADLLESPRTPVSENFLELRRLKSAIDYMDTHFLRNPALQEVAEQAGLAPNYFHRLFKKSAGLNPFAYMERRRLDRARRLLFDDKVSIKEVAAQCGYDNQLISHGFSGVTSMWPHPKCTGRHLSFRKRRFNFTPYREKASAPLCTIPPKRGTPKNG
jgi:AraC-like DNA-binding protein